MHRGTGGYVKVKKKKKQLSRGSEMGKYWKRIEENFYHYTCLYFVIWASLLKSFKSYRKGNHNKNSYQLRINLKNKVFGYLLTRSLML